MSKLLLPGILQQQANQQVPASEWEYEGELTIEFGILAGEGVYGYGDNSFGSAFGSITPSLTAITGYNAASYIAWHLSGGYGDILYIGDSGGGNGACNVIELDGVEYELNGAGGRFTGGYYVFEGLGLPTSGTVTIKMK